MPEGYQCRSCRPPRGSAGSSKTEDRSNDTSFSVPPSCETEQRLTQTATITLSETRDDTDQAAADRYLDKAALVADHAWQQTVSDNVADRQSLALCSHTLGRAALSHWQCMRNMEHLMRRHEGLASAQLNSNSNSLDPKKQNRTPAPQDNVAVEKGAWQQMARVEDSGDVYVSLTRVCVNEVWWWRLGSP